LSLAAYPDAPNKAVHQPIRGLLTTIGFMMTDSANPDVQSSRNSLWITGGTMVPNNTPSDVAAWKGLFGSVPPRTMGANAKLLAMKWLLGAVVDDSMDATTGSLQYNFTKPIGGHGKAYFDTLYADSSLRIVRGHRGTLFVFSKQPDYQL
jgi:PAP_fibrillin